MKHKRTHKEIRNDSRDHYGCLADNSPDLRAMEKFKRPAAYQAGKLIADQGRQMESKSLLEYLAERYNIKEVMVLGGQEKTQAVQGADKGAGTK